MCTLVLLVTRGDSEALPRGQHLCPRWVILSVLISEFQSKQASNRKRQKKKMESLEGEGLQWQELFQKTKGSEASLQWERKWDRRRRTWNKTGRENGLSLDKNEVVTVIYQSVTCCSHCHIFRWHQPTKGSPCFPYKQVECSLILALLSEVPNRCILLGREITDYKM